MKKALSIILALCLVAAMLPMSIIGTSAADVSVMDLEAISLGETKTVTVAEEEGAAYLKFTPAQTGYYLFKSESDFDTYGYIYNEEMHLLAYNDDKGYDFDFCVGCAMETGKTYVLKAMLFYEEEEVSFDVTVIESPVKSIETEDISLIENTNGYINYDEDDNPYFSYYYDPVFTVTLKNNQVLQSEYGMVEIDGDIYKLEYFDDQYSVHWTAGNTYSVTGYFLGLSDKFDVTITETPVKSLEIEDVSLIEHTHGYFNFDESEESYYEYTDIFPKFKVTLKNDEVLESDGGWIEYNGEIYVLNIENDQFLEHWTVGNTYKSTASILGFNKEFNVTVIENPIASLEIEDTVAETNIFGDVYITLPDFAAHLKDGSTVYSKNSAIIIDNQEYWINFDYELYSWEVGENTVITGYIGDVSSTFNAVLLNPEDMGLTITGTLTSYGNEEDIFVVVLFDESGEKIVNGAMGFGNSTNYAIYGVEPGNYILSFAKQNHVIKNVEITVEDEDIVLDEKINLKGDVNGDGFADKKDLNALKGYINESKTLTEYEKNVLDLNDDGYTDKKDLNRLKKHINETEFLW